MSQPRKKRKVVRCSQTPRIKTYFVSHSQLSQSSADDDYTCESNDVIQKGK